MCDAFYVEFYFNNPPLRHTCNSIKQCYIHTVILIDLHLTYICTSQASPEKQARPTSSRRATEINGTLHFEISHTFLT